jgi:osmotically-inducible protein OsmY
VENEVQHQKIVNAAKSVHGVKMVVDEIQVRPA